MTTYAKVICDSISPLGCRLTSIEIQFPRFVLPQLLMHRQWSRSCESLRARPVKSKLAEVEAAPYRPVHRRNQKGMVAGEELSLEAASAADDVWVGAFAQAAAAVRKLEALGVAKETANRLLEPFAYQKVLVTATDFENFFRLRCADDAQPEIAELAVKMREALRASEPKPLYEGDWHLPYFDERGDRKAYFEDEGDDYEGDWRQMVSTARVARVSYCNHDGSRDVFKDLALATTLIADGHSNPLEAVATPACDRRRYANHRGWISYRYVQEQQGRLPNPEG